MFSEFINDDLCLEASLFEDAHVQAMKGAISYYENEKKLDDSIKKNLIASIEEKHKDYVNKRKKFIERYGQSLTIKQDSEISNLDGSVTSVIIDKVVCQSASTFDISKCSRLEQLVIRDGNFKNVALFRIANLPCLSSLTIGDNCFNGKKTSTLPYSFSVTSCDKLEIIDIGRYSFKDYSKFNLDKLPSLRSLVIGDLYNESSNFVNCSFCISS